MDVDAFLNSLENREEEAKEPRIGRLRGRLKQNSASSSASTTFFDVNNIDIGLNDMTKTQSAVQVPVNRSGFTAREERDGIAQLRRLGASPALVAMRLPSMVLSGDGEQVLRTLAFKVRWQKEFNEGGKKDDAAAQIAGALVRSTDSVDGDVQQNVVVEVLHRLRGGLLAKNENSVSSAFVTLAQAGAATLSDPSPKALRLHAAVALGFCGAAKLMGPAGIRRLTADMPRKDAVQLASNAFATVRYMFRRPIVPRTWTYRRSRSTVTSRRRRTDARARRVIFFLLCRVRSVTLFTAWHPDPASVLARSQTTVLDEYYDRVSRSRTDAAAASCGNVDLQVAGAVRCGGGAVGRLCVAGNRAAAGQLCGAGRGGGPGGQAVAFTAGVAAAAGEENGAAVDGHAAAPRPCRAQAWA